MFVNLYLIIGLLLLFAVTGSLISKLPKNIWLLFVAQPLLTSPFVVIVLAGGLLSVEIAPLPELATLPLTLLIVGTASTVIPASLLMKKIGRKNGTLVGCTMAIAGTILALFSAMTSQFLLLVLGSFLIGCSLAVIAQLRFAAIESVDNAFLAPKAISTLMTSGLFTAMLGPEIAVTGTQLLPSAHGFAGSFLIMGVVMLMGVLIISFLEPMKVSSEIHQDNARKIIQIIKQPIFMIAFVSAVIAYSVMSFLMTATPLNMNSNHHYDLDSVKWVVQSHIIAMYLPSLFYAYLEKYFGIGKLMIAGTCCYVLVVVVAMAGHSVMHFWWSMVFLGIGWNFLFTSGTLLLPRAYNTNERFKVQAVNDFGMFTIQAVASLLAGIILFSQGWSMLLFLSIPVVLIMFLITLWYYQINIQRQSIIKGKQYEK